MKRLLSLLLALFLLLPCLTSCKGETVPEEECVEIDVYRVVKEEYRTGDCILRAEPLRSGDSQTETLVRGAAYALMRAPENIELLSAVPQGVRIEDASLSGRTVTVLFSGEYSELSGIEKTVLDSCVTLTMCSIPGVDYVSFRTAEGGALGTMSSEDILLRNTITSERLMELRLYFPKAEESLLASEYRQVTLDEDMPIERHIIDELLKGPLNNKLAPILPEDTAVLSVYTQDGLCTVSFSEDFLSGEEFSQRDVQLAVFSIVNSLTCLSTVDRVQINVRNNTEQLLGDFDISQSFGRKNSIIGSAVEN